MDEFPTELNLHLFSHFHLRELLVARAVNKHWKELVAAAPLHPVRRRLFCLYAKAVASRLFLSTRPYIIPHLHPFDREGFVYSVEEMIQRRLPEEFRMWLLEWPARAATAGVWPGLPQRLPILDSGTSFKMQLESMIIFKLALLPEYGAAASATAYTVGANVSPHRALDTDHWVSAILVQMVQMSRRGDLFPETDSTYLFLSGKGGGENLVGKVGFVNSQRRRVIVQSNWLSWLRSGL